MPERSRSARGLTNAMSSSAFRTPSTTLGLSAWTKSTRKRGVARSTRSMAAGIRSLANGGVEPIEISGSRASCNDSIASRARRPSLISSWACGSNTSPASVSREPRPCRSSSAPPTLASRWWMLQVNVGWLTPSRFAALRRLPADATATNRSSCTKSMPDSRAMAACRDAERSAANDQVSLSPIEDAPLCRAATCNPYKYKRDAFRGDPA